MKIKIDKRIKTRIRNIFFLMLVSTFVISLYTVYHSFAEIGRGNFLIDATPLYRYINELKAEKQQLDEQLILEKSINTKLHNLLALKDKKIAEQEEEIKRLKEENEKLKEKITQLEAKNRYLENAVTNLKNALTKKLSEMAPALKEVAGITIDRFTVTAYAPAAGGINCGKSCNVTAKLFTVSAIKDIDNVTYCAVDPKVIPMYSILIIQGFNKPCVAVDTGGSIKGNRIDILMHSVESAQKWGRRTRMVIIIPPK